MMQINFFNFGNQLWVMNNHPREKVLIFNVCFILFMQDKKQVQNFEFEHTFSLQKKWKNYWQNKLFGR